MNDLFSEYAGEPLYIQLYMYYREMIIKGVLKYGDKLPSVRKCAAEFALSKMTVESAYMQLTAEGYVFAKSQSGYYVSKISDIEFIGKAPSGDDEDVKKFKPDYDLSGSSVDIECFDFNLWQKYVKNALRCEDRLLSYGEAQGEYDLRKALSEYASKERGVVCSPSQIVIGAGVQSLIQLLCALDDSNSDVIFVGAPFEQGTVVFKDYKYRVIDGKENYDGQNRISFIYVSPSHSNKFCDVMNISARVDLLNFARAHDCIIIEDDYDSEFCYFSRPVSSLQSLDGGRNVAYIGTFSKLLLPSIRISFMVLPVKLAQAYKKKSRLYNQTASKTEQIALARYITDMRLITQIRKARKHYENKAELMKNKIISEISPDFIKISDSGFMIYFDITSEISAQTLVESLLSKKVKIKGAEQIEQNHIRIFVSSASIKLADIDKSVKSLKNSLISKKNY
jgi:GntR family transcriptional regulator/MocR family aminotransferase